MKSITSFVIVALAALAAAVPTVYSPAATKKNFTIDVAVSKGEPIFGGRLLVPFHTGAGTNAVTTTTKAKQGALFYHQNGHLINSEGTPPFPAGIILSTSTPYNSSAPNNFNEVDINAGYGTGGFSINSTSGLITFTPPAKFADFRTFVLCKVNQIAYAPSAGPQYQLLWRKKGSRGVFGTQCADVVMYADI